MHLHIASIEVTHVLLLDKADENSRGGLLRDGKDVHLGEPILNLHDASIHLVASTWLHAAASTALLRSRLVIVAFSFGAHVRADFDLIIWKLVPCVSLYELHKACGLGVYLAQVDICVSTSCQILGALNQELAWVDLTAVLHSLFFNFNYQFL